MISADLTKEFSRSPSMKSLIWKEWRENVKWTALPALLILGPIGLLGLLPLMDEAFLVFAGLVSSVYGAALGFVQVYFESSGDKRSLLLHRPLSSSRIFLGKVIVGVGLYLLGVGIPFACVLRLAATPEHIPQPFEWPMVLPWLADALTGLVFYFAGMLAAQREARWYGSRCLGMAAGLFCCYLVWTLPEFWQALLAIMIVGGVVALAAWGSFHAAGAYAPQPFITKIALAATLLMGLSALSFTGKVLIGAWCWTRTGSYFRLDRQGNVLLVQEDNGHLSLTDLEGRVPAELEDILLDAHALAEIVSPRAQGPWPRTTSYRNSNRNLVKYGNDTQPSNEWWWYVPSRGRLFGYDKPSYRLIGSFGPDGFSGPAQQPSQGLDGELLHYSRLYSSWANDYLVFPNRVYKVDFRKRAVRSVFVPAPGETVRWASRWENESHKLVVVFVLTDKSIHVVDDAGFRMLSMPLASDLTSYQVRSLGRLENPVRYWVWYEPAWYLGLDMLETMPAYVAMYDGSGREISPRQSVAPRPGLARESQPRTPPIEASAMHTWFGLLTPPVEVALLVGATRQELSEVRASQGSETGVMLQVLTATTQYFLPGVRWSPQGHTGLVLGFGVLMFFVALLSGLSCLVLARRHAFSRASSIGWAVLGFVFGWVGLVLMIALHEWPARITCLKCRRLRVVTREHCENCRAPHALPEPDGTEIFEPAATLPSLALSAK
jgi:hypothetical protein